MHPILAQTRKTIQNVVRVLGFISGGVAAIAPIGVVFFASVGVALACFMVWIWLDDLDEPDDISLWPPHDTSK
jgi:hypothetical protein